MVIFYQSDYYSSGQKSQDADESEKYQLTIMYQTFFMMQIYGIFICRKTYEKGGFLKQTLRLFKDAFLTEKRYLQEISLNQELETKSTAKRIWGKS